MAGVWNDVPQNVPQKNTKLPANFDTVVLDLIKQNNKITREEIASKYNVGGKTITRRLKKLNVIFVGRGINGHWEIR
jgi:predicted HTH transcriptional regulator